MATLTILLHAAFEQPARIAEWAEHRGHSVQTVRLYAGETVPESPAVEALILMGGPMSVHDETEFPWLAPEKALIRTLVEANKPVLGICLGAQLIASALDGRVARNPAGREIGWWPVRTVGTEPRFALPDGLTLFHWHGEECAMPPGAVLLAESAACRVQAFRVGERCLALQCHPEVDAAAIEGFLGACEAELTPGQPFVQTADALRTGITQAGPMHRWLDDTLQAWLA